MPILCFEGPSAVGKTTTAAAVASAMGAYVIPEVNALFERPASESPEWYFERQIDRWHLATAHSDTSRLVILDGDPFQPLWYSWSYDFQGWQSLDFMERFYRPRISSEDLSFPDLYILFGASTGVLRQRKQGDVGRRRGGFETHLRFIAPQRRYFATVQTLAPEHVSFIEARSVEQNVGQVQELARTASPVQQPLELFRAVVQWLRVNPAA